MSFYCNLIFKPKCNLNNFFRSRLHDVQRNGKIEYLPRSSNYVNSEKIKDDIAITSMILLEFGFEMDKGK